MWRYFRDYFPISLVKTAELDSSRNYLLCCFPHGVISTGAFGAFGTEAVGVSDTFPGMRPTLVTLAQHFASPFVRDLALALGKEGRLRFLQNNLSQRVNALTYFVLSGRCGVVVGAEHPGCARRPRGGPPGRAHGGRRRRVAAVAAQQVPHHPEAAPRLLPPRHAAGVSASVKQSSICCKV